MKIVEYFKETAGYKDPSDKTLALARDLEDLPLRIREVKAELQQKVSVSVDGKDMEIVKGSGAEGLFKDLVRFRKQRDDIQKKLDKIEKFSTERNTFSCPSEAMHAEKKLMIAKSSMMVEANFIAERTKKKFKNQIPKMIENALEHFPDETDPEKQLVLGCIIEGRKLSRMKAAIDKEQEKIDNWIVYKDDVLDFINKVVPDEPKS